MNETITILNEVFGDKRYHLNEHNNGILQIMPRALFPNDEIFCVAYLKVKGNYVVCPIKAAAILFNSRLIDKIHVKGSRQACIKKAEELLKLRDRFDPDVVAIG